MSQALVDLAPLVPAGTRMVIVHGVATSTRQRLASLLPEATVHDLTDLADLADLAGTSGPAGARPVRGAEATAGAGLAAGAEPAVGAGLVVGADLAVMEVASHVGQARIAAELLELAYHLREGAVLLVVTARRLGSARQLNTLEGMFGAAEVALRSGSAVVLRAVRGPEVRATADATAAAPTVEAVLLGCDLRFTTGAGLFSKNRIDDGSRLLIEALPPDHDWRDVLDLGCGYGPIGIAVAARWPQVRVAMADIDPLAVSAARTNAGLNGVEERCQAHLSDGTSALADRRFDAVLSHLPTHVPKSTLARLIDESANVLRPGGELIAVTASAVDLRDRIASTFGTVEVLAESRAGTTPPYRVVHAVKTEQPRR
ncbi:MAG: methyltransferase [Acidimicrobiaceae bacterium]|nr:methyltransferase [Acidimicrobiaceae bacterium]